MLNALPLPPSPKPSVPSEEVCILSASGTAAILNPRYMREGCLDIGLVDQRLLFFLSLIGNHGNIHPDCSVWFIFCFCARFEDPSPPSCGFCHIPYDELNMPFPTQLTYCYHCRRQKVARAKPSSLLSLWRSTLLCCLFVFTKNLKCSKKNIFEGSRCSVHHNRPATRSSCCWKGLPHPSQVGPWIM